MTQQPEFKQGWYTDPEDSSRMRYFDGSQWTEQTRAATPTPALKGTKTPFYKKGWFWVVAVLVLIIGYCSGNDSSGDETTATAPAPAPISSTAAPLVAKTPTPTPTPSPTPEAQPIVATTEPEPEPAPPPAPAPPDPNVYYKNCDAARAAGAAPLYQGDPGYRPGLDGDHDGVACESK